MNKSKLIILISVLLTFFFGCNKWSEPEFKSPDWVPPKGTTASQYYTIKRVLDKHTNSTAPDSITSPRDKYWRYIKAVVVSSDEGGNYYKSMVIQDSTGGVELELDMTGLYNFYPVGQKVVLVANGLVIGDYNNLKQIGWIYQNTQVGRINSAYFNTYIIKDGVPSAANIPKPLKNDDINFSLAAGDNLNTNKLVSLEGVTFKANAIGNPLSYSNFTTDWIIYVPLKDGTNQEVTVRTSNFAKFRSHIISGQKYTLTGILTVYNNFYQLMLRTKADIKTYIEPFTITYDFTNNAANWSNLTRLEGQTIWGHRNESMQHAGNQSLPSYKVPMDDWFISPTITMPSLKDVTLRFIHQVTPLEANYEPYKIYYTTATSIDPFNESDWHELGALNSFPSSFDWSNDFPMAAIGATTFRIAFRYYAPDDTKKAADWLIKKVEIK